jgi:hypothetical protein
MDGSCRNSHTKMSNKSAIKMGNMIKTIIIIIIIIIWESYSQNKTLICSQKYESLNLVENNTTTYANGSVERLLCRRDRARQKSRL